MTPRVAHLALGCGLAMLIPLPFLDAYIETKLHRAIYADVAATRGVTLPKESLDVLSADRTSLLKGCLFVAVIWPLKKLFRTILYFLTVKDVLDAIARASLRASMVEEALELGQLPARTDAVRSAMDLVSGQFRVSPVSRSFWLYKRPELVAVPGSTWTVRLVRWLTRLAGAGLVLPAFRSALIEVTP